MGTIAIPEMRRFNYAPTLAVGIVAAGGTLSFLIPPSLGFVVYGMLTEQSIGKLLVSGILPGILLSLAFIVIIVVEVKMDPSLAPATPGEVSLKEKILALSGVWETLLVFVIVMGGIYLGLSIPRRRVPSALRPFLSLSSERKIKLEKPSPLLSWRRSEFQSSSFSLSQGPMSSAIFLPFPPSRRSSLHGWRVFRSLDISSWRSSLSSI